jgi:hypothetical protein
LRARKGWGNTPTFFLIFKVVFLRHEFFNELIFSSSSVFVCFIFFSRLSRFEPIEEILLFYLQ